MNKYTAVEFLGGETGRENADKESRDFCCTLRVFGNALFMRVWRGRKKGRTYFKIPRTFFKFSQTYFLFAPTCPFAHSPTKTQKRVKIAGQSTHRRKWIFIMDITTQPVARNRQCRQQRKPVQIKEANVPHITTFERKNIVFFVNIFCITEKYPYFCDDITPKHN